jgi:hypothetical protein
MSTDYLRRYTDIPSLVSILTERKITLLDPSTWDDKNDSRFIELYKDRQGLQSVLGLCFTQADETYHHWRVFANGSAGVCIKFDRAAFIKAVKQTDHIRMGTVRYLTLTEIRDEELELSDLPFLKRYPFQDENEFRLIHESRDKELPALDVPIPLSCIDRITLSPWMHKALSTNVKNVLRSIKGCTNLDIARSTLIKNEEWYNRGKTARHGSKTIKARRGAGK